MKKIINFLRKIGIIHIGSGDYMTGGFDTRKDLKSKIQSKVSSKGDRKKGIFLFWIISMVGVLFIMFSLILLGFSFWFFVVFISWAWFIFSIKRSIAIGSFILKSTLTIFISIFIVSFVLVLFAVPSGSSTSVGSEDSTICEATNLKTKVNDRISIDITDNDDVFLKKTKTSYTLSELDNLSYGFDVVKTAEGEYVIAEVCAGDKTLSFTNLNIDDTVLYQDDSEHPSTSGSYSQFVDEQFDGSFSKTIEIPGKYIIYVYSSVDGEKWYIAREFEIEIK